MNRTSDPHDRRPPVRAWLLRAACWFSALTLTVLTPSLFNGGTDSFTVNALRVYLLAPMALCFAAAGLVRLSDRRLWVRLTLHALLSLGGFWLFGYLPYRLQTRSGGTQMLIMALLALFVYAVLLIIWSAVTHRRHSGRSDED